MANLNKHHPSQGDLQTINGLPFIFDGGFWTLTEPVRSIDRFHNYSGRQGHKRPYGQNRANATLIRTL